MEYEFEQLVKKHQSLPKDIQEVLSSTEVIEKILKIASDHKLLLDGADVLADQTSLVLLGLTSSGNFIRTLKKELGISEEEASSIAQAINNEIFLPVRKSLQMIQTEAVDEPEEKTISKEDLLNEIENPTASRTFAREIPKVEAIIDPRNELPAPVQPLISPAPQSTPAKPPVSQTQAIIDQKLSQPTSTRKIDPYREPI